MSRRTARRLSLPAVLAWLIAWGSAGAAAAEPLWTCVPYKAPKQGTRFPAAPPWGYYPTWWHRWPCPTCAQTVWHGPDVVPGEAAGPDRDRAHLEPLPPLEPTPAPPLAPEMRPQAAPPDETDHGAIEPQPAQAKPVPPEQHGPARPLAPPPRPAMPSLPPEPPEAPEPKPEADARSAPPEALPPVVPHVAPAAALPRIAGVRPIAETPADRPAVIRLPPVERGPELAPLRFRPGGSPVLQVPVERPSTPRSRLIELFGQPMIPPGGDP